MELNNELERKNIKKKWLEVQEHLKERGLGESLPYTLARDLLKGLDIRAYPHDLPERKSKPLLKLVKI